MFKFARRMAFVALLGALLGPACLVLSYAMHPALAVNLDDPSLVHGFFPVERGRDESFAWTGRRADVTLAGLDRQSSWSCTLRFRGARPDSALAQPDVAIAVDGVGEATYRATNTFTDVEIPIGERPLDPGATITLTSSTTFVPGPGDTRALGVQVESLGCRPAAGAIVLPPRSAMRSAALSAAVFGAGFALTRMTPGSAVAATALIAGGQAWPMSEGAAPYIGYAQTFVWYALGIALSMVTFQWLIELGLRQALRKTAIWVLAFSAGTLYLQLLGLFHPSKGLVDAVFHAHRFDAVLRGSFYFTQLSTSATPFPYAIGLFVFAAPWAALTADHVTLLRVVVCASATAAAALLYLMVVRTWGDRLVGAVAVALFAFVPLPYAIVGNANLTHAFAASVALATVAAATAWRLEWRRPGPLVGLVLLATLGFTSHISTLVLLLAILVMLAFFDRVIGGRALGAQAAIVLVATILAGVLSVALYWGHFGDVYKAQIGRMRNPPSAAAAPVTTAAAASDGRTGLGRTTIPLTGRIADAWRQTTANIGWPILVLALVGAWRVLAARERDRLSAALAAWIAVWLLFVALSVILPGDRHFQQDAWEFIGRVEHVACPALVILAARGGVWAWRAGAPARLASIVLFVAAVFTGVRAWSAWFA